MCLALVAVSVASFLYVQIKLTENRITEAKDKFQKNQSTLNILKQKVELLEASKHIELPTPASIRTSLVKFDEDFLTPAEEAQLAAIQEVNRLAKQNNVLPSEISFDSIEQKALEEGGTGERGGKSLFPGLEMSFTVEGSYADVRRFLMVLERSQAFLIINSLDLKSVEPSASGGRARANRGAATDQVVALGVKLSVYYRREGS
jgi:hypothetical protein